MYILAEQKVSIVMIFLMRNNLSPQFFVVNANHWRHTYSFTNKLHKYSLNIHIHVYSPVNDLLILWLQCRQTSKLCEKKEKFINILIRFPNTLTLLMPERRTTITNTAAASLYSPFSHILKHLQHFTPFVRPLACQHLFYYPFCCCCHPFFVMNYTRCILRRHWPVGYPSSFILTLVHHSDFWFSST